MRKQIEAQLEILGILAGMALLDYGLSLAWYPLGFIFSGLELATVSFLAAYGARGVKG